jgi:hypothetical protein
LVLGSINGFNGATVNTKVGIGIPKPAYRLDVADRMMVREGPAGSAGIWFNQNAFGQRAFVGMRDDNNVGFYFNNNAAWSLYIDSNGQTHMAHVNPTSGSSTQLCLSTVAENVVVFCGSSSARYKTDILPFSRGMDAIHRMNPVSFTWKQGGVRDVGVIAEEIAEIDPLLAFRNDKGEIEGVKYDRLGVVFINALKEQQAQIEQQQNQLSKQQQEIDKLSARLANLEVETSRK